MIVLTPESEEDLAEMVRDARAPLRVFGGDTRPVGHVVEGEGLTTAAMTGITLYEPGALTLVAKAGTPVAEIEAALAAEGQMLAFEPMDHRALLGTEGEPTIGGVVAGNVSGPRRVQAGACRDFLLGVRFVDGRGEVVKSGGRVMKNVTGYDLVKLMAGSRGTLGVLSEVSLKVLPKPEAVATLLIEVLPVEDAVSAMSASLGSPFEVSGAAHVADGFGGPPVTMIRVEGFRASVDYRAERLQSLLAQFGDATIEIQSGAGAASNADQRWQRVRDVEAFADFDGDIWRFLVKPGDAPGMVRAIEKVIGSSNRCQFLLDWAGGLIWAGCPSGADLHRYGLNGHETLIRASDDTKARLGVFQPEVAPLAALAEGLRRQFDPRGILNPGLMG